MKVRLGENECIYLLMVSSFWTQIKMPSGSVSVKISDFRGSIEEAYYGFGKIRDWRIQVHWGWVTGEEDEKGGLRLTCWSATLTLVSSFFSLDFATRKVLRTWTNHVPSLDLCQYTSHSCGTCVPVLCEAFHSLSPQKFSLPFCGVLSFEDMWLHAVKAKKENKTKLWN